MIPIYLRVINLDINLRRIAVWISKHCYRIYFFRWLSCTVYLYQYLNRLCRQRGGTCTQAPSDVHFRKSLDETRYFAKITTRYITIFVVYMPCVCFGRKLAGKFTPRAGVLSWYEYDAIYQVHGIITAPGSVRYRNDTRFRSDMG